MPRFEALRASLALLVATLTLTACGGTSTDTDMFEAHVHDLRATGGEVAVSNLVDGDFDTVTLFNEGATPEEVEAATGLRVIDERYTDSRTLLVVLDGQDSELVKLTTQSFDPTSYSTPFGPNATLSAPEGGGLVTLGDG